jgi:tRNA (guanine-N7-)-methyltransferase
MREPYDDPPRLPGQGEVHLDAFVPGPGALELEIGPGRGAFLLGRAAVAPEARLLGIEVRRKWACVVDERLRRAGFGARARVVWEDARTALGRLRPEACVARAYLHFPDPWWKKRHHKRRLLDRPLCDALCRLLDDAGELFVQTDVEERALAYEELFAAHPALAPAGDAPGSARLSSNPFGAASNRERRCLESGLPVYRLLVRRHPRAATTPP